MRGVFLTTMFSWIKIPAVMLAQGQTYKGLTSAAQAKQWQLIQNHIEWKLKLPDDTGISKTAQFQRSAPIHSALRLLLVALATQLVNLRKSADNERNPTPWALKKGIESEVRAAFDALFQTCERLEVVAQQGVDPSRLQGELEQEAANLRQLLQATEEASAEMARLTLSAGRWKVAESSDKFEKLGWAARELTRFNRELDE